MRFQYDHDYHIHSYASSCATDPAQTPERILQYAEENGLREIVLTDHFWDEKVPDTCPWYEPQNFAWISQARPLPQSENVRFLFGAEADMDKDMRVGVSKDRWDEFDFVVLATTHMHHGPFSISEEEGSTAQGLANAWIRRLDSVLSQDLPFHKIGIAHLACSTISRDKELVKQSLMLLPDNKLEELFRGCAKVGVGIEINFADFRFRDGEKENILRIFKIAKEMGCKFYFGGDIHRPIGFPWLRPVFENAVDLLGLTEEDKFHIT